MGDLFLFGRYHMSMSHIEDEFRALLELLFLAKETVQNALHGSNKNLCLGLTYYYDDGMYFGFKLQLSVTATIDGKFVNFTTYDDYDKIVHVLTNLANSGLPRITVPLAWCAQRATKPDGKTLSPAAEHIHQQCAATIKNMQVHYCKLFFFADS